MALTLTVEDGSNVAGADSFATLDQIKEYNLKRGVALPDSDDAIIAQSNVAMDYLGSLEPRFAGDRTYGGMQSLCFPRTGVFAFSQPVPPSLIPPTIIAAQCYLVGIAGTVDLYGNKDTLAITKEVIGPIETDYSATQGAIGGPVLPTLVAMLQPYFKPGGGMLTSRRV